MPGMISGVRRRGVVPTSGTSTTTISPLIAVIVEGGEDKNIQDK